MNPNGRIDETFEEKKRLCNYFENSQYDLTDYYKRRLIKKKDEKIFENYFEIKSE